VILRALISDYVYINNYMLIACDEKLLNKKKKTVVRMKPAGMRRLLAIELKCKCN
jgi:hypothetical protein